LFPDCGLIKTYKKGCRCNSCSEEKRQYNRNYQAKNREKIREQRRQYRDEHREEIAELKRKQYAENRESVIERSSAYYYRNREAVQEKNRVYYQENREAIGKQMREYRKANSEAVAERNLRYRKANQERLSEYFRRYRKENPEVERAAKQRRRARLRDAFVEEVDRIVVFERDDYICQRCGKQCDTSVQWPHGDFPTLDHIIPLAAGVDNGGVHSYANSQTLCLSCNSSKGART
jgi:5-methylcytosine-specific restriction endonuclease McrA